jgi:Fe-Mn family superoxide dismutase
MTPGGPKEPVGELADAIKSTFGSVDAFKKAFNDAGLKRFGSGWAWLILTNTGKLEVVSTANQDSPLSEGHHVIIGNDVWEHAYYLKYQNRRGEYLEAWWNVLNWEKALERYQLAKK